MSTERDDGSVERSDDGVDGTAPRRGGHPEPGEHAVHGQQAEDAGELTAGAADGPQQPRSRRIGRSRLAVAAVAVAVLLAGGGGAYWAATADSGGSAAGTPAPLQLDGPNTAAQDSGSSSGTAGGGATYQLTGSLPKGPDSAAVYQTSGEVPQADVQRLAKLLGVTGPVTSDQGSWRVGPTADGGGPALLVGKTGPGTWSYARIGTPAAPAQPDTSTSGPGPGTSSGTGTDSGTATMQSSPGSATGSATGSAPGTGTAPVSAAKAEAVAAPLFDGLGLSGARIDAAQTVGAMRLVTADPVVGGLPTHGWSSTVQVGSDGVLTMGYGRLSTPAKGATYPVVSASAALKELQAATGGGADDGTSICAVPVPEPAPSLNPDPQEPQDRKAAPATPATPTAPATPATPTTPTTPTVPATPTVPGQDKTLPSPLPCVPGSGQPTEVRGAVFGLSMQFVSGAQTLVPSWLFDTAPAGVQQTAVVAQPAVDPAYVRTGGGSGSSGTVAPGGPASVPPATPIDPGGPEQPASPAPSTAPAAPGLMKVTGYQVDGSTLSVTFYGGVCDTYRATAAETAGQVRVTVTATPKKSTGMCMAIAREFTEKVTLDSPLGTRAVVDTSDGQSVRGQ